MPSAIAIAAILAIVVIGLGLLVLGILSRRNMLITQSSVPVWLSEKSTEKRHEEHRDYLRERAKNDRHQDLD